MGGATGSRGGACAAFSFNWDAGLKTTLGQMAPAPAGGETPKLNQPSGEGAAQAWAVCAEEPILVSFIPFNFLSSHGILSSVLLFPIRTCRPSFRRFVYALMKELLTMDEMNCTLPRIGTITIPENRPLNASNWTLGCETLDRDFADFDQYCKFIPALGIQTIRLQGGWAKTEKVVGVYDFQWLDHIIDKALSMGCRILLETDYGNPLYPGGGGHDLSGGFPTSEEALAAWDRWVEAMAIRYKEKVSDWAMWNEPDLNPQHKPADIAAFNIRTAKIIKRIIPDARIAGLSLASSYGVPFEQCLSELEKAGALSLFDWFIYHGYTYIPEDSFAHMNALKRIIRKFSPSIRLRQGENGCPSEMATKFALKFHPWTETTQAKWDLRRFIGDLSHDVESAVFTICDFNHLGREINRKGLLLADENHRVIRPKEAYGAIARMTWVFDGSEVRESGCAAFMAATDVCFFSYRRKGGRMVVYWDKTYVPGDSNDASYGTLLLSGEALADPVLADIRTGALYEIPPLSIKRYENYLLFEKIPYYDSPLVIGERGMFV